VPPKAEVKSAAIRPLWVDGVARHVIQAPKPEPRSSCATNSPTMNGPPSNRCCRTSRGVWRVSDRRVLKRIFRVLRSGAPWRDVIGELWAILDLPASTDLGRDAQTVDSLPDGQISDWPVQPFSQKYSASRFTQINSTTPAVLSHRGAYRDRHGRGAGCGGRGSILRASWSQGGFPVSDHKRADERCLLRTAKSCGPDAPALASSWRRHVGPTGF
jgi:hypothetical protein